MKAKGMILLAIMALIGVLGVNAQEIIPVDTDNPLTNVQKKALQEAKVLTKKRHNKIKLPIEINSIVGDSLNKKRYESNMNMNEAYFVNRDEDIAHLVIPMQAKANGITINSNLNIVMDTEENSCMVVRTMFAIKEECEGNYLCLQSSVNGFLSTIECIESNTKVAEVKGKDYDKAGLYTTKIVNENSQMELFTTVVNNSKHKNENILNNNDWRNVTNRWYNWQDRK